MLTEAEQANIVRITTLLQDKKQYLSIADICSIANGLAKRTAYSREKILELWADYLLRDRAVGIIDRTLSKLTGYMSKLNNDPDIKKLWAEIMVDQNLEGSYWTSMIETGDNNG